MDRMEHLRETYESFVQEISFRLLLEKHILEATCTRASTLNRTIPNLKIPSRRWQETR
jgi:hypothetical protein